MSKPNAELTQMEGLNVPVRTEKPWGHELLWALTDRYAGKMLHVNAGQSLSLQYHREKDEWMYCLAGEAELLLGEIWFRIGPGAAAHIPAGTIHRVRAVTDVDLVEVSSPELDDIVRLADDYGRGTKAANGDPEESDD